MSAGPAARSTNSRDRPGRRPASGGAFARLGRGLVRHPWYPIAFWVVLAVVGLPFVMQLSGAEANSATSLPSSAPSAVAASELARLFPSASGSGSSSVILLEGPSITGPVGQNVTLAVAGRIAADANLSDLGGVSTLYSSYASYLAGMTDLAAGVIGESLPGSAAYDAENATAQLAWGPPTVFLSNWAGLVASNASKPPSYWNAPAYRMTASALAAEPPALSVLRAFYGAPGTIGWNGTNACALEPANVTPCATEIVRSGVVASAIDPSSPPLPSTVETAIDELGPSNFTSSPSLQAAAEASIVAGSTLPAPFVSRVAATFPSSPATSLEAQRWADGIAYGTPVAQYPLPVPVGLAGQFVDASDDATLILVDFTEPSGYTAPNGTNPVLDDVHEIDRVAPAALARADPAGGIALWQTGDAALNAQESSDLSADLAIVLPLTVVVLVGITMVYFRSPLTPLVTFGTLGIALLLSLVAVVAIGAFVTKVDPTSITLSTTFVLGVGTDYSVFLVARYREELLHGAPPKEAVVTSVTWAGQSIATSGATAILATLALAFSGVGLLSQWGMVLSASILIALLASLTMVPAVLALVGPRLFWPETGRRFVARATREREKVREHRSYFYRAAARSQRRPVTILAVVLIVSAPLFWVALQVPLNYDFYAELPGGEPASTGLAKLGPTFGPGYAFPSFVLVTFRAPLLEGNVSNVTEFTELAGVGQAIATTPGVATVDSPVGPNGAPLGSWTGYGSAGPLERTILSQTLFPYLGTDGRTLSLTFQTNASGLSTAAVGLVQSIRHTLDRYAATHPGIESLAYGGGAQTTADLEAQTALATERMVAAVTIGLIVVLLVVLRSYWIPPMAVATIGLSIGWAWAATYLVLGIGFSDPIFYFVPTILFLLILGLGIDYNIFLLTRVREERLTGVPAGAAASEAVARTGGIITAAAIILASAFAVLATGRFLLLTAIGFSVAVAILLDAMVVRTYLVPALLHLGGERVWSGPRRWAKAPAAPRDDGTPPT